MKLKLQILFFLFISNAVSSTAQLLSAGTRKEAETYFYRVKDIEDFIDRFNNDPGSSFLSEFRKKNPQQRVARTKLLLSLFNLENEALLNSENTRAFYNTVVDSTTGKYLSFTGGSWYAMLDATFSFHGSTVTIPLVLTIWNRKSKGTKWMIAGIGDHQIFSEAALADTTRNTNRNTMSSIPATNHAVSFLELHKIFNSTMSEYSCFDSALLQTMKGRKFVQLIKGGSLRFQETEHIRFCFLQIENWAFTVEEFTRNKKNSGWLINDIIKLSPEAKAAFIDHLLYKI